MRNFAGLKMKRRAIWKSDDNEQVVVFRLDKKEFGVPIESVQEIVRVPEELTHTATQHARADNTLHSYSNSSSNTSVNSFRRCSLL